MRTPNTQCMLCDRPLYRRPSEMARTRFAACMAHRSEAQKAAGITDRQLIGLSEGRVKGENRRTGCMHREETKRKMSESHKKFCAENPDRIRARGEKVRGERNYRWKGGASKFNTSIRQMHENRMWMDAVKARDEKCVVCGATDNLESHHIVELTQLLERHRIRSREDARNCAALWDIGNGKALCQPCHYAEHGRTYREIV